MTECPVCHAPRGWFKDEREFREHLSACIAILAGERPMDEVIDELQAQV